jgi:hypothetical protein
VTLLEAVTPKTHHLLTRIKSSDEKARFGEIKKFIVILRKILAPWLGDKRPMLETEFQGQTQPIIEHS